MPVASERVWITPSYRTVTVVGASSVTAAEQAHRASGAKRHASAMPSDRRFEGPFDTEVLIEAETRSERRQILPWATVEGGGDPGDGRRQTRAGRGARQASSGTAGKCARARGPQASG